MDYYLPIPIFLPTFKPFPAIVHKDCQPGKNLDLKSESETTNSKKT